MSEELPYLEEIDSEEERVPELDKYWLYIFPKQHLYRFIYADEIGKEQSERHLDDFKENQLRKKKSRASFGLSRIHL